MEGKMNLRSADGSGNSTAILAAVLAAMALLMVALAPARSFAAKSAPDRFSRGLTTQPTVTSLSPAKGGQAGGKTVTITGTNFVGVSSVKFGAANARSFSVVSPTSIKAVSPAAAPGVVDVTVTTPEGTSATSSQDQLTFVAQPVVCTKVGTLELDSRTVEYESCRHCAHPDEEAVAS
jgi:hypothetical protein